LTFNGAGALWWRRINSAMIIQKQNHGSGGLDRNLGYNLDLPEGPVHVA
jgi:hypothetical protein